MKRFGHGSRQAGNFLHHPGRYRVGLLLPLLVFASAQAAEGEAPVFDIQDYAVEGNTVLDVETVEQALYPHLGPGKGIEDVERARVALETAYRDHGYPTVVIDIPEQDVDHGQVRLKVVEGRVAFVQVTGSRYYALGKIKAGIPALAEGQVPHMPEVQQQVAKLAEQSADRTVTPVFRAGQAPGQMEVELKVTDQLPLHGSVELNSRNTDYTHYTRLIGSLRYDNLWQRFHSASLQYQTSPENSDELEVWSGTYVLPTGLADTRLALYGVGIQSSTQLGANVGGTSVVGTGAIYGLRLVKPLEALSGGLHSLTLGFDYKQFDQAITLAGQDTGNTPIHYAPFLVGYEASLRWGEALTSLNAAGHVSIRGLGNDPAEFQQRRDQARANFFYFTADLKHQQTLPADFQLATRLGGQISPDPLISNEQFSAGGVQSVRGYHQTQQLGDSGLNASVELYGPRWLSNQTDFIQNLRLLGFYDWASLWIERPLAPNPARYTLASAGLGLRMQIFRHFQSELDWAYPFYRQGTVDSGQQRLDFRVSYAF
jgi:hemolysin activation/secretion protein